MRKTTTFLKTACVLLFSIAHVLIQGLNSSGIRRQVSAWGLAEEDNQADPKGTRLRGDPRVTSKP